MRQYSVIEISNVPTTGTTAPVDKFQNEFVFDFIKTRN